MTYEFDMAYLRIISEIQKHFKSYPLFWDCNNNHWAVRINNHTHIALMSKQDMWKDADISDPDTYNCALMQMIGLIDMYGRTDD